MEEILVLTCNFSPFLCLLQWTKRELREIHKYGVGERHEKSHSQSVVFIKRLSEIKRESQRIHRYGCRCNERLKAKTESSKRLAYTGLCRTEFIRKVSGGRSLRSSSLFPSE